MPLAKKEVTHHAAADRLCQFRDELLRKFLVAIRRDFPAIRSEADTVLADSLPELILEICNELREPSKVEPYRRVEKIARKHATDRSGFSGYSLIQMLSEYHILRRMIVDYLVKTGDFKDDERRIVNNAIDRGIAHAGQHYFDLWINERNERINQLADENVVHEQFVSALSHDLRNPLAAIRANLELISKTASSSEQQVKMITSSMEAADRMNDMIGELLDIGRTRAGKTLPISPVPTELKALVEKVVKEMGFSFGGQFIIDAPNVILCCDPLAVRRCLENLISNALKFGVRDRPITILIEEDGSWILLCVFNEGDPIPDEIMLRLFQPFERSDAGIKDSPGWGIGLFVVKNLVEAHSGKVDVESSKELGGTRFRLWFPKTAIELERCS